MADFIDQPRDPDLTTLLELFRDVVKADIHVMLPGKIVSYDPDAQKAVVQALVRGRFIAEDGSTITVEDLPPIHEVPVEFCGPARGRITWPVDVGDLCEIRFASSSLARWIRTNAGPSVDPGEDRRHDLTDAICFVGLHTPASPPTDAPQDAVVIHVSGGNTIKLGSSGASHPLPQGDNLQSALNTFLSALNTYIVAIQGTADPSNTATPVLTAAISVMQSAAYLSSVSKTD